ncbi:MAG: glycosyltransferase involved in cell wall biosynthesis [Planctomycetota bacterium]|jgi:glycosyltransferase involved in cell wall biosynthesis
MRILITSPVFPPDLGGPAVYVPSVGRFLVERGHDVRVIAFCSDPAPEGYPFPVQAITRGPLPVRYLKAFWAVFKAAGKVDVVYVQEHLALLHVLAARLRFRPVVIRIMVDGSWEIAHRKGWCGDDNIVQFQGKSYGWKVGLARFLQKRWWGMTSRIICCSEFLRGILVDSYGVDAEKAVTVLNAYHGPRAADVPQTRAEARAELGLPATAGDGPGDGDGSERRYVLSICRLMGWKRVDGIIRGVAHLEDPSVHLLVAGDGDMEDEWRRLSVELGLEKRVHFLGNVPHSKIPMYIRAADVFVLNSEYEGLSHTLLEVQALGTPMIASGVCGNPEVVEDGVNGLLVDPDRPDELAAALGKILNDPELGQRFVQAGFARGASFDRETTFSRVEELLKGASRRS